MTGKGRKLTSMFVLRGNALEYVTPGNAFRRIHAGNMTETAEIKAVYTDQAGIPHVRYDVIFEKSHRAPYREGPRILALKTFFQNFDERVGVGG